jgi:putative SOS response-associated peptidase YedK
MLPMPRPKSARCRGEHELFGFLTTEANAIVAPIHPKAMPVVLTSAAEVDLGLRRTRPGPDASAAIA